MSNNGYSQSCGFGCLGLSGFYGGYTFQNYDAEGLNQYIKILHSNYSPVIPDVKFSYSSGFRIGANFFRANFDDYFVTAKGYYQFLKEEHSISAAVQQGSVNNNYTLVLNHWGIALDIGIPLFKFLDWKILEGGVQFFNSEFKYISKLDDVVAADEKYDNYKTDVGYYLGSGVIIHLIKDYISIEGSAAYNIISISHLQNENDVKLPGDSIDNSFIENGGFAATIQLNVGVPL